MHSSYYLKVIQEFTANTQNTHDYYISSSVTMVLLQLSREYWGDVPDEKMSQGLFAEEKHSRNAELSIYEDFILKEHADYIGEIQKGKQEYFQKRGQAFARCKQELTVYAYQDEYKHYKDGILYVLGQAEEKISCYDFTFPYLVVEGLLTRKEAVQVQSAQKGYRTHIVAFPLIEVLSLLWLKINDPRSQLDKKAQILEMFQWFQSISMSAGLQICHHGLRNDLVLNVLNDRYYPDIHLIRIPTAAILHHTLLEGMKKQVIDFDRICKGESNQAKLKVFFTYLSAKKAMLEEFSGYLISQGCDPAFKIAGISLEDNSDACMVAMLEFSEALSTEELKVLNQLYAGVNWDTETEPTLLSVYQWLEENYSFEESEKHEYYLKALREFLEVSHAYHTIKHNASYVVMLGKGEEAKILWASCRSYFASLHSGFDPHILKAQQSFVQQARQFNQEINKFRASHMEDDITQFFAKWVAASDSDDNYQLRNLYVFLCNPEVQQKILITDTYLEARLKQLKPGETELEISPYEANRIFLTAIIKEPLSWSPAFEKVLMLALQSVKRDLNSPGLQTSWKQSSFPDALIRQLEYLLKCREDSTVSSNVRASSSSSLSASSSPSVSSSASSNHHAVIPRPMKILVLPENIETNYDWFRIHAFLNEEECIKIYAAHQEKIDGILIKYIDLLNSLAWRAGGWRDAFIVEDDMPDLVQWTLRYTLKSIPQQYLPKFLEKLSFQQLAALSTTLDGLRLMEDFLLSRENKWYPQFIREYLFSPDHLLKMIQNERNWHSVIGMVVRDRIPRRHQEALVEEILRIGKQQKLNDYLWQGRDIAFILGFLSQTTHKPLEPGILKTLFDCERFSILNWLLEDFRSILEYFLPPADKLAVLQVLKEPIYKFLNQAANLENISDLLRHFSCDIFPPSYDRSYLEFFMPYIQQVIQNSPHPFGMLDKILTCFGPSARRYALTLLDSEIRKPDFIQKIITNIENGNLSVATKGEFNKLKSKLCKMYNQEQVGIFIQAMLKKNPAFESREQASSSSSSSRVAITYAFNNTGWPGSGDRVRRALNGKIPSNKFLQIQIEDIQDPILNNNFIENLLDHIPVMGDIDQLDDEEILAELESYEFLLGNLVQTVKLLLALPLPRTSGCYTDFEELKKITRVLEERVNLEALWKRLEQMAPQMPVGFIKKIIVLWKDLEEALKPYQEAHTDLRQEPDDKLSHQLFWIKNEVFMIKFLHYKDEEQLLKFCSDRRNVEQLSRQIQAAYFSDSDTRKKRIALIKNPKMLGAIGLYLSPDQKYDLLNDSDMQEQWIASREEKQRAKAYLSSHFSNNYFSTPRFCRVLTEWLQELTDEKRQVLLSNKNFLKKYICCIKHPSYIKAWQMVGSEMNNGEDLFYILERMEFLFPHTKGFVGANHEKIKMMIAKDHNIIDILRCVLQEDELAIFIPESTKVDEGASSSMRFSVFASKNGQVQENESLELAPTQTQRPKSPGSA